MDKDKLTETERKFLEKAEMKKYNIYRNGWPDFLLVPARRSRKMKRTPFCVEVKKDGRMNLSNSQRRMREGLKRCGITTLVSESGKWIEPSEENSSELGEIISGLDKLDEAENHVAGILVENYDENTRKLHWDIHRLFDELKEKISEYRLKFIVDNSIPKVKSDVA